MAKGRWLVAWGLGQMAFQNANGGDDATIYGTAAIKAIGIVVILSAIISQKRVCSIHNVTSQMQ